MDGAPPSSTGLLVVILVVPPFQNLGILKINSYRQYCGSALVSICIQGEKTMRIQILAGLTNTIT